MRVAVVGGGYAGLAAAVTLAANGVPPVLFEAGAALGGRARAVAWRGLALDNGPHLLLGAYRETLRLMDLAGAKPDSVDRLPLGLSIHGRFELRAPRLPAPLHLMAALLSARGLGWRERLSAVRFASALRLHSFRLPQDLGLAGFLARHRQDGAIGRLLWEPLCLAALNTPPEVASAQVFLNVLRDSFSHARADSDLILPRVDLGALFPEPAAAFVLGRGGRVVRNARIRRIAIDGDRYLLSHDAGEESFSHVVCATAPQHALPLLGRLPQLAGEAAAIAALSYQPIATAYLQYPSSVRLPQPMLGLDGGIAQWLFDRGRTHGTAGLVAAVASAEGEHMALPRAELAARIRRQIEDRFGLPEPLWQKVIVEKRAGFSCTVGLKRPSQKTALDNFFLAGDYTAGDYPATLEGAVRSGVKCAKFILGTT